MDRKIRCPSGARAQIAAQIAEVAGPGDGQRRQREGRIGHERSDAGDHDERDQRVVGHDARDRGKHQVIAHSDREHVGRSGPGTAIRVNAMAANLRTAVNFHDASLGEPGGYRSNGSKCSSLFAGRDREPGTIVDPTFLGLGFEALVFVTMKQEDRAILLTFEEAAAAIPNVLLAQRLFGDPDYLLRMHTADLDGYQSLRTMSCPRSPASSG